MPTFKIAIVGAGPAGIFTAYELVEKSNKKVLLVDKGFDIYDRKCPILEGKVDKCPVATRRKEFAGCYPACSITDGFGGAGAYSDGKFNITTEFGGWLDKYMSKRELKDLILDSSIVFISSLIRSISNNKVPLYTPRIRLF
mgnify:CR=1 FL=1